MQPVKTLALWGVLAPCFALLLSSAAIAQSSPSDTTPAQNDAQYQAQQQQYQEQLQIYKANEKNCEEKAARYEAARDRYIAAHARYHRDLWPSRYEHDIVVYKTDLLGARVATSNGHVVGHVEELALAGGHVDALRVALDRDRGDVWIEAIDLRFDADEKLVVTDLDREDLYAMSHESF
ncbi:MAG: PRC-barrel domain-containing protein [Rhizomicrobium sp.]